MRLDQPGINLSPRITITSVSSYPHYLRAVRLNISLVLILVLSACATKPFLSPLIESATFTERAVTQKQEMVEVAAAVLGADDFLLAW